MQQIFSSLSLLVRILQIFSVVLPLAKPVIVYVSLVKAIIRFTRYCLERHPHSVLSAW